MAFKAVVSEGSTYTELWIRKSRSRGVKPYVEPLPYHLDRRSINMVKNPKYTMSHIYSEAYRNGDNARNRINEDIIGLGFPKFISQNGMNEAHNRALRKVSDQLEYVTNLFEAWYERREAYALLGSCIRGIATFAKRWRDPRYWSKMRKAFKVKTKNPSSLPEAWLLWQFAIKPLVGTVDDIINLLSQPMPSYWVEGVGSFKDVIRRKDLNYYNAGHDLTFTINYVRKIGVRVIGLNPNAQLSNILGVTTPISSALSVVPWVWAVNYFVNLNEVVSNLEVRFPGVIVDKSYTTTFLTMHGTGTYNVYVDHEDGLPIGTRTDFWWPIIDHVYMDRTVGSSIPSFKVSLSYPTLGSTKLANLTSAIALAFKGKTK